tara:strand:+ start:520 stop:1728 length:1209 start_codon:yes stop_codon:yes gene_type:complete
MDYKKTVDYLFQRLPFYQREGSIAYKKDIGNIIYATKHLNNPHKKFKSIHIAGTNGKGSTAHMLKSILMESGLKIGLYSSPHIKDLRERIKINGEMISKKDVISFVKENKKKFEKIDLSFFEFMVALSFDYFAKKKVDIAIIETGLGGRLDSTNIITPILSIITNISIDHTNLLGNTIEKIALEKAGIIKKNVPVVIGKKDTTKAIFNRIAKEKKSIITYSNKKEYESDLKGKYQAENINTAATAISVLQKIVDFKINSKDIASGLLNTVKNTGILGRWQILKNRPLIICDIGHNVDGIKNVVEQIKSIKYRKLHFVFGTVNDKEILKILVQLPKDAKYYFCAANIPRAMNSKKLKKHASKYNLTGKEYQNVKEALKSAEMNSDGDDLIFIGGSTFVVSEIL